MDNGTHLVYTLAVNWESEGSSNAVIARTAMVRVEFDCVFETHLQISMDQAVIPLLEKTSIDMGVTEGQVDVSLGLYQDNTYMEPLEAGTEIYVPEDLFVGADIENSLSFVPMFQECWATPRFVEIFLDDSNK